ncbi:type II toxin-antitoxin system HicA family toxin [Ruminobacter sp. RM87]|uniref:type II toxin-antitoxin system HicA family toxin n=1 Tax=Ruminobacter sp. RM87 TaxID=1200567 RepID=UPI0009FF3040
MKKRDLEKAVRANGARPVKGSNHDKWYSKKGYMFTIPRHREIDDVLAKQIIKQSLM